MAEALRGRTKVEWVDRLNAATVSCGPINTVRDLETDPHVLARQMIVDFQHPAMGRIRTAASPLHFSDAAISYRHAPPLVGEQTDAVLAGLLGLSAEDIARLRDAGIV